MRARRKLTMQLLLCLRVPTLAASWLCRTFRRNKRETQSPAILVVRLDGLGDSVLTLPLLDQLRQSFPGGRISVLSSPAAAALLQGYPAVDEVIPQRTVRAGFLPLQARTFLTALYTYWTTLRGRHFDIAINPRWDVDVYMATFLCALTRASVTVGFEDATTPFKAWLNRGFEKTWNVRVPPGPLQHEVLHGHALARALGCEVRDSHAPRLPVSSAQEEQARQWIGESAGRVLIALGLPAADPKRRWNIDGYITTLRLLNERFSVHPIVLADEATAEAAERIAEAIPHSAVAMRLPLLQTAAVLKECVLFIGSDSGLGHIAAAVGCPTITLSPHPTAGDPAHPNSPLRFRPYGEKAEVLQPSTARPGCESSCVAEGAHCIDAITPEQVVAATLEILSRARSRDDSNPAHDGSSEWTVIRPAIS